MWCHNLATHGKNEVVSPHIQQHSLAPCLADPVAGDRAWCHNFANHGENEVMAPEGDKMGFDRPRGPASGAVTEIPSEPKHRKSGWISCQKKRKRGSHRCPYDVTHRSKGAIHDIA